LQHLSPVTSKPASRGRIKTGHSDALYLYQVSLFNQGLLGQVLPKAIRRADLCQTQKATLSLASNVDIQFCHLAWNPVEEFNKPTLKCSKKGGK
jgi:hypothetical protein